MLPMVATLLQRQPLRIQKEDRSFCGAAMQANDPLDLLSHHYPITLWMAAEVM
jgi:hypothetical protein